MYKYEKISSVRMLSGIEGLVEYIEVVIVTATLMGYNYTIHNFEDSFRVVYIDLDNDSRSIVFSTRFNDEDIETYYMCVRNFNEDEDEDVYEYVTSNSGGVDYDHCEVIELEEMKKKLLEYL